ncbi:MAG: hypothetical protein MUC48_05085 [Leptolyngbya sp. Prado105]|jgi:hypothetical protein|nr:hypothetical protein [Leptolyngbya sp. Prado105]
MAQLQIDPKLTPSVEYLKSMIDYADRRTLSRYEDGRKWFLLPSPKLSLSQVAWAALHQPDYVIQLVQDQRLLLAASLAHLPGGHFICIYFEDAYWLADFDTGTR